MLAKRKGIIVGTVSYYMIIQRIIGRTNIIYKLVNLYIIPLTCTIRPCLVCHILLIKDNTNHNKGCLCNMYLFYIE